MIADALVKEMTGWRALRLVDSDRLRRLTEIDCVAVVGSTATGKSTLISAVRAADLPGVEVPVRFVTRPPRLNEEDRENVHVAPEAFARMEGQGELGLSWARTLEGDREERYGFPPPSAGRLPVYSGNNALYERADTIRPPSALTGALFVGVFAPDAVREARFRHRSPDLWEAGRAEALARLADPPERVLAHVQMVVENHGPLEGAAREEIVRLCAWLAARRGRL